MHFRQLPVKLHDCKTHGPSSGSELFIVEGDSASQSIASIRNEEFQAVLPMQGKPINAAKASRAKVRNFELFAELARALGYDLAEHESGELKVEPEACRFQRIILLLDPDADGMHCEALLLIFFHRMLRPLLAGGKTHLVRAPMFRFSLEHDGQVLEPPHYAYSEAHARQLFEQLESIGLQVKRIRYRGLAGMHRETLLETCVVPESRRLRVLGLEDAEAALAVFGGQRR